MKKKCIWIFSILLSILLCACGKENKGNKEDIDFNEYDMASDTDGVIGDGTDYAYSFETGEIRKNDDGTYTIEYKLSNEGQSVEIGELLFVDGIMQEYKTDDEQDYRVMHTFLLADGDGTEKFQSFWLTFEPQVRELKDIYSIRVCSMINPNTLPEGQNFIYGFATKILDSCIPSVCLEDVKLADKEYEVYSSVEMEPDEIEEYRYVDSHGNYKDRLQMTKIEIWQDDVRYSEGKLSFDVSVLGGEAEEYIVYVFVNAELFAQKKLDVYDAKGEANIVRKTTTIDLDEDSLNEFNCFYVIACPVSDVETNLVLNSSPITFAREEQAASTGGEAESDNGTALGSLSEYASDVTDLFAGTDSCYVDWTRKKLMYYKDENWYVSSFDMENGIDFENEQPLIGYSVYLEAYCFDDELIRIDYDPVKACIYMQRYLFDEGKVVETKLEALEGGEYVGFDTKERRALAYFDDENIVKSCGYDGKAENVKMNLGDVSFVARLVRGAAGYAFVGGIYTEEGRQSKTCYGFIDDKGNVSDLSCMDLLWYQSDNIMAVCSDPLAGSAIKDVFILDADDLTIKKVGLEESEETKRDMYLDDGGNYLITAIERDEKLTYKFYDISANKKSFELSVDKQQNDYILLVPKMDLDAGRVLIKREFNDETNYFLYDNKK